MLRVNLRFWPVFLLVWALASPLTIDAQMRKYNVCVTDYSVGAMPLLIAKHHGYFAQEKLEVDVLAARGNLCTMGLIANSFQFTYSPSTFDAIVGGDVKGKVIYVAEKFLLHRLIVAPQIKSIEELKGKKIAISAFGTLTDLLTREILGDNNLRPMQDVILLQTGGAPVRYAALKSGNVDAALLSSQYALTALHEGFRNLEYTPPPFVSHPLITRDDVMAKEKPLIQGFLRAMTKGHLFFGQKQEETLSLIQKLMRISDRKAAKENYEDEMRRYNPGGGFESKNMRRVIERAREARKMERKVEIPEVFDLSLAVEAWESVKKSGWQPKS
jgi:NitT/TauT family transport system substrate-binding protein